MDKPKSTRPFSQTWMDFIVDLPPIDGYDSIMSVVDHSLSKGVILIPCNKKITSEQSAQLLLDNLYKRFGLPDKLISDRGSQFAAKTFQELCKLLGIKSALSTAYHLQSDGTTERFNQDIEAYLSIYCIAHPEDWLKALPTLEFTHNNKRHADRKSTPFELIMGSNPIAIPTSFEQTNFPTVEEHLNNLIRYRNEALAAHELAQSRMIARTQSKFEPFKKGQQV